LGAAEIIAVDYDEWSIENAAENLQVNKAEFCKLLLQDNISGLVDADILLANINRHILLAHMEAMKAAVNPGGIWLLSGLLEEDEPIVSARAAEVGMIWKETTKRNGWISLVFEAKSSKC
jgi:ribosomal protein L11 methyltransferase